MADYSKVKWKELFAAKILGRGYNYYLDGNVWDLHDNNGEVSATVAGSEDYCVTITLAGDRIAGMTCDCPYAADGKYCKHEAAVLYALTEEAGGEAKNLKEQENGSHTDTASARKDDQKQKKPSRLSSLEAEMEDLKRYIDCMSEDEMKYLLYQLACSDESLGYLIAATYSDTIDEKLMSEMKAMVDQIEAEHSDQSGFIDWRHASDFISDLIEFLYSSVSPLIDRGLLEAAFELTCYVFLTIGGVEIDDDGDIAMGAGECCKFWEKIVSRSSDSQQEHMYDWFSSQIGKDNVYDYMKDYLDDFRMTGFHSEKLLKRRLDELDEMIKSEAEEYRKDPDSWSTYKLIRNINNRIETMIELEMPRAEVLSYMEKYTYIPDLLIRYAETVYEASDPDYAAELLQKGKTRDAANSYAVRSYSQKLIEFYTGQDMMKELADELKFQVLNCYQKSLQYIKQLKKVISEKEWLDVREDILKAESCRSVSLDLMHEEKLYDRLMKEIRRTGSIGALERYEKDLRPDYSQEVRDMYADHVREEVKTASDRKLYRSVVADLRKIRRYDGGPALAESIAESWKQEYKRRTALIDELGKAGF